MESLPRRPSCPVEPRLSMAHGAQHSCRTFHTFVSKPQPARVEVCRSSTIALRRRKAVPMHPSPSQGGRDVPLACCGSDSPRPAERVRARSGCCAHQRARCAHHRAGGADHNGGINGRPIQYVVVEEQTNPQQVSAAAAKLIQDDKVVGIVGSTSLIDCPVNHAFYEQNNFNVIVAGVPSDCFSTPNIAAVNMGPYYSSLGAAQALVRAGVKTMVAVGANVPGGDRDI